MADVKAEAGITPKPKPQGASVTAIAGGDQAAIQGAVGEGRVGGDRAEFRGVAAEGKAGQLGPVTLDATAQVVNNASVDITLGAAVSVSAEVIRAPFSSIGIAEHIASDPGYYRRLSEFASAELTQEIAKFHGRGNADLVIKGELVELQQGFAEIANHIGAKAYDAAAAVVVSLKVAL
jgi:hypothetical protein